MADLSRDELQRLARLGAEARLRELRREEDAIRQAFPDLFRGGAARGGRSAADASARPRRQYRMSAAQKKAVSERMKKYWAARRRQKERAAK